MVTRELTPYQVKERLKEQFNCKVKQVPRGDYLFVEVKNKKKAETSMLFGCIPFSKYTPTMKQVYFDKEYTLSSHYYRLSRIEESVIQTALDLDNMTVYWRYV